MAPGIALDAIGSSPQKIRVLDPMAGSGTVLAVAHSKGHEAIGTDLDPLAVLLAGVWTRPIDAERVQAVALDTLRKARDVFRPLGQGDAYPANCDPETAAFVRYWFDGYARRQLAALATAIRDVRDRSIKDALWVAFSRLIITKSAGASLAMDLSHSRPHREFERAPVKPFNRFLWAVNSTVQNCPRLDSDAVSPAIARLGDARKIAELDASIDLVLTSPPYLNAIDYMRCSKFSLVWMGYSVAKIRGIRGESVGAESSSPVALNTPWVMSLIRQLGLQPTLSSRNEAILARYVWDMGAALSEVSRVLKTSGRAIYVVGDSTVRGTFIQNSFIVEAIAEERGLKLRSRTERELPANRRYLPPPSADGSGRAFDARMRKEVILEFAKSY
jgi:hypothetical protein